MSESDNEAQVATENAEIEDALEQAMSKEKKSPPVPAPPPADTSEEDEGSEEKPKSKGDKTSELPDDPDDLKREIEKLRKENAAKRVKNREVEQAAKKWQEHVDSQKSELQKLQELAESLQEENKKYKLKELQSDLAKEHGVDPDLAEFIIGADLEEMTEKAKKLAKKTAAPKKSTSANDLRAGRKSDEQELSGSKWLRELFK